MTEAMRAILLKTRRTTRTIATMLRNSVPTYGILVKYADEEKQAALKAVVNMTPITVRKLRSIADEANTYLATNEITSDQFIDLSQRAQRVLLEGAALGHEVMAALEKRVEKHHRQAFITKMVDDT